MKQWWGFILKMVTGGNICPICNKYYSLSRNSFNPQSILIIKRKNVCFNCFKDIKRQFKLNGIEV